MKHENKIIRETYNKYNTRAYSMLMYFNDKRKNGRRKAYKSFGRAEETEMWKKILRSIRAKGVVGWKLHESMAAPYVGIVKHEQKQLSVR